MKRAAWIAISAGGCALASCGNNGGATASRVEHLDMAKAH